MKKLFVDIGNSRTKYQFVSDEGTSQATDQGSGTFEAFSAMGATFQDVSEIWCSCVGSRARYAEARLLLETWSHTVSFATSGEIAQAFKPAYTKPELMGVDRWLALLAVKNDANSRPIVVVDAGTALTLDVLVGDKHLGGYIVPGYRTQLRSLVGNAALPAVEDSLVPSPSLGQDTQTAMSNGVWLGLSAMIMHVCSEYPNAKMVVTGGDGKALLRLLNDSGEWRDNLVIEGLQRLSRGFTA